MSAKTLTLDIEYAPHVAHIWKCFKENIPVERLLEPAYVLCWSAKWLGESKVMSDSLSRSGKVKMLKGIHKLLEEADIVITYFGKRSDIPRLYTEFLEVGLDKPSPFKQIDLFTTMGQFSFPSKKLGYIVKRLGIGEKLDNEGHPLWIKCMDGVKSAWHTMVSYNIQDTVLTEALYLRVRQWVRNHPNVAIYETNVLVCPHCASKQFKDAGFVTTKDRWYQQFKCLRSTCGAYFRGTKSLGPVAGKKFSTI